MTQYQSIPTGPQAAPRHAGGVVDFDRDFFGGGARWIAERELGAGRLTVTAGIDYDEAEDARRGYQNFVGPTLGIKGALRRNETDTVTSTDPYLQAQWKQDAWLWTAGVRHPGSGSRWRTATSSPATGTTADRCPTARRRPPWGSLTR